MNKTEKQGKKPEQPNESAVHTGNKPYTETTISHIAYNKTEFTESTSIDTIKHGEDASNNNLLLVSGLHNIALIEEICTHFEINALVLEDILNRNHIPKIEDYGNYIFITIKDVEFEHGKQKMIINQYSFIYAKHLVICFSENNTPIFDSVLRRAQQSESRLRRKGADYLLYEMLDVIIDRYIVLCENLSTTTNKLEENVYHNPGKDFLRKVLHNKKNLTGAFHCIAPIIEQIPKLKKTENELVLKQEFKYIDDLIDHLRYSLQSIDSMRELNISIRDSYTNELNLKMNKVMQVLTLVATIFIPLSFFAGVYGMNFENMPELHTRYGYYVFWALIILLGSGFVIYFKKKKWF